MYDYSNTYSTWGTAQLEEYYTVISDCDSSICQNHIHRYSASLSSLKFIHFTTSFFIGAVVFFLWFYTRILCDVCLCIPPLPQTIVPQNIELVETKPSLTRTCTLPHARSQARSQAHSHACSLCQQKYYATGGKASAQSWECTFLYSLGNITPSQHALVACWPQNMNTRKTSAKLYQC